MVDYRETTTITDDGPKLILEATAKWEDFTCFKYPQSCQHCCIGWRTRCPVNVNIKRESYNDRPDGCPLGLVVLSIKD